jgi:hypothetical protein
MQLKSLVLHDSVVLSQTLVMKSSFHLHFQPHNFHFTLLKFPSLISRKFRRYLSTSIHRRIHKSLDKSHNLFPFPLSSDHKTSSAKPTKLCLLPLHQQPLRNPKCFLAPVHSKITSTVDENIHIERKSTVKQRHTAVRETIPNFYRKTNFRDPFYYR